MVFPGKREKFGNHSFLFTEIARWGDFGRKDFSTGYRASGDSGKNPFKKEFLLLGKVDCSFIIHNQPSFQMVEFVLGNAGKKILVPFTDPVAMAIAGSDFDFRETVDLHLDIRAGETSLRPFDRFSPGLRDAGVDEQIIVLFPLGPSFFVKPLIAEDNDFPVDSNLWRSQSQGAILFQKGVNQGLNLLSGLTTQGKWKIGGRSTQNARFFLGQGNFVPEG